MLGTSRLAGADHDELAVERALLDLARSDRVAFGPLYRRHVNEVFAFAFRRCGSREVAEEATSATFERALLALDQFEWRGAGLRPWLLRIASNEVADIYRTKSRSDGARGQMAMQALAVDGMHADDPQADDVLGDTGTVDLAEMHTALDRLTERYRAVISLRYLAGMSPADAAAEMGCTTRVLAVTLHRALNALRTEMGREDGRRGRRGER